MVEEGRLYTWGCGMSGRLGVAKAGEYEEQPQLVEDIENVTDVECGQKHTIALAGLRCLRSCMCCVFHFALTAWICFRWARVSVGRQYFVPAWSL